jgi:hypothetical protein
LLLRGQVLIGPKETANAQRPGYPRVDVPTIKALHSPLRQSFNASVCVRTKIRRTLQINADFSSPHRSVSAGQPARTASDQWHSQACSDAGSIAIVSARQQQMSATAQS